MKNFKKVIIFLTIIISINIAIYFYPMNKILSIYTNEVDNITMSAEINPIYGRLSNILKSDTDEEYKRDAILTFGETRNIRDKQRNEFYKILLYCGILISIIIFILGFVIRKKSENNKYIGSAFITSSIFSIILLTLYSYSLYLTTL